MAGKITPLRIGRGEDAAAGVSRSRSMTEPELTRVFPRGNDGRSSWATVRYDAKTCWDFQVLENTQMQGPQLLDVAQ